MGILDDAGEQIEHSFVDSAQTHRRESALEEATSPTAAFPLSCQHNLGIATITHREQLPDGSQGGIEVTLKNHAGGRFFHRHRIRTLATRGLQFVDDDCTSAKAASLNMVVDIIGRQDHRAARIICQEVIDGLWGCGDDTLSPDAYWPCLGWLCLCCAHMFFS